jgi:hypothetical protein
MTTVLFIGCAIIQQCCCQNLLGTPNADMPPDMSLPLPPGTSMATPHVSGAVALYAAK